MNKNISIVIIHTGYQDYLKHNLEITGINNHIYLIGDQSIKYLEQINNVTFINIEKYRNLDLIKKCKAHFKNYSSNSLEFEWLCFERVFILKHFLINYKLNKIFHIDSDNILLMNINNYEFQKEIAYCLNKNFHKFRMSHSIHSGLLNINFCDKFIELYQDIYINKTKLYLIQDKINYHIDNNSNKFINGGICDMTLYYLLVKEKILDVQNLIQPINGMVFITNINNGEGYDYQDQYLISDNKIKLNFNNNKYISIYDIIKNKNYNTVNIHFQGSSKIILQSQDLKNTLFHILI